MEEKSYRIVCPTCQKRIEYARTEEALFRPFCSKRCQLIDLDLWFREEYRISRPMTEADEAPPSNEHAPRTDEDGAGDG